MSETVGRPLKFMTVVFKRILSVRRGRSSSWKIWVIFWGSLSNTTLRVWSSRGSPSICYMKKIRKSELFQWHTNRKIKLSVPGGARLNHGNARTCSRRLMTIEHIAALSTRLLVVTTFKRMLMYFNRSCNITTIKERPTGKHIRCK